MCVAKRRRSNTKSRGNIYMLSIFLLQNIVIGISGGLVACINAVTPRRQEVLLYMAVSVVTVNLVNFIIMEYCFYIVNMPRLLKIYNNHILINYGKYTGVKFRKNCWIKHFRFAMPRNQAEYFSCPQRFLRRNHFRNLTNLIDMLSCVCLQNLPDVSLRRRKI